MVRHLVRLKFALLRGAVRRGGASSGVALFFSLLLATGLGAIAFLALLVLRTTTPATAADAVAAVFAVLLLGWVVAPLVALASDNTLDIDRLSLFPLSRRQLMPGLLLSAAVGPGGLFTALVLLGVVAGTAPAGLGVVPVACAAALEFLLCMATSRLVSTSLSAATSKRRWRDVALFVGPLLALAINATVQLVNRRFTNHAGKLTADPQSQFLNVIRRTLRWAPSGWGAQAIHGVQANHALPVVLGVIATAGLIVGVVALWWRAIQTATTNPGTTGPSRRGVRGRLIPRAALGVPHTALGAIVAKELRYMWREPRRRAALLGLLTPGLFPLLQVQGVSNPSPRLCLIAALPMLTAGGNSNIFGFDADRVWVDVVAGISTRTELMARTIARAMVTVPLSLLLLVLIVMLTHSPSGAIPAIGLMTAAFGVASGYAAIASVRVPFPMPDTGRGNVFGGGASGRSGAGVAGLVVVFGAMASMAPLLIATLLIRASSPAQLFVLVGGIAYGFLMWRVCLRVAVPTREGAEADLLARLTRV